MDNDLFEELCDNIKSVHKPAKTIVVGDIHGHIDSVEAALASPHNVVFVGDYLDSFGQSVDNQVRCLTMVLDAIEAEPGRVVGLIGNHEMSYLEPSMQCSGYNNATAQHVKHMHTRMRRWLREYWWVGDYLITHAGVDQELLDYKDLTLEGYLANGQFNDIGRYRGGSAQVGGLYWNDFNAEMTPINGVKQVVGHSNGQGHFLEAGVRVKRSEDGTGETWCVDNLCREAEVLMIDEDGEAYPYPLHTDPLDLPQEPHTCPYSMEMSGGEDDELCDCSWNQENRCADDI